MSPRHPPAASSSAFLALGRSPVTWLALAAHAALGLGLLAVPLFDVLGFERALASALLTTVTAPVLGVTAARRGRREGHAPLPGWGAAVGWSALALIPSLLAGLLFEVTTQPCAPEQGALFFLLLGGGNLAFGVTLGFVVETVVSPERRWTRAASGGLVAAILLAWLGGVLTRLYREPQIFAYATPFGYWPGSIYDEAIAVQPALWAFRGFGLLLATSLLGLTLAFAPTGRLRLLRRPHLGYLTIGSISLAGALWAYASGGRLGFDLDRADVVTALARRIDTEHFILHTDPTLAQDDVAALAEAHELAWLRLRRFFGVAPEGRITSFVYRDPQQKGRLMGGARTQIARPWISEIHIHGAEVPHRVLEHELAHIFAGALAEPPLRIPLLFGLVPNIGLIEGVAVAADDPVRELTLHQWAAAMLELDRLPPVSSSLDPAGFWRISSARAYTAAGSFVAWLIDQRGIEPFGRVYRGERFAAAYGQSATELEVQWRRFLAEVDLGPSARRRAEHRFSTPSIFGKTCARASASLSERAYGRLRAGDLEGARPDLETLYRRRRSDPRPLVALGRAFLRAGDLSQARALADRAEATSGATESALAEATELQGEIAWRAGNLEAAARRFTSVAELQLSTASQRLQAVRLAALDLQDELRSSLRAYLGGELAPGRDLVVLGALAHAHPEHPIVRYLYARRLESVDAPQEGLGWSPNPDALPSEALRDEARLVRGRLALAAGTPTVAAAQLEAAAEAASLPAARAEALDWAERAHFRAVYRDRKE